MSLEPLHKDKPATTPTEKEMESWFGMLDDASKAEVMKAKIAADAEVAKAEITSTEYQTATTISRVSRWLVLIAVVWLSSCTAMCVSDKWETVQTERIHAEHPAPPPLPSASAAASGAK